MEKKNTFYVTTPIYYANGKAHLGGAYTTIAADVLARLNKTKNKDVFFLTGTDEHGQKIQEAAEEKRLKPKKFVDEIVKDWKKAFKLLNISNDNFIRTTNPFHEKEVKKLLQELYKKDLIYKSYYEALYCVGCEQYLTKSDLIDGKCPLHKKEPEIKKEEAYLFRLSKFQDKLLKLIKSGEYCILPKKRRNEIITFIESGLEDVSISRLKEKIYWGIELPFDKKHCAWVWPDAFWNYLTGIKEKKVFNKFWPANVQLMAKDIFRVHATIWPALLLASENKLPKTLFIHGYFTINGQKMSKSLGNIIDPIELINIGNSDSVRYYLMRNIAFGEDGDVSKQTFINRHNNELADKLGNLVSRVSALAEKYEIKKTENKLLKKLKLKQIEKHFNDFEFDKALNEIFAFIDNCNEYIQQKKPWEKEAKDRQKILYELSDSIKAASILLWPFIPETCEKIAKTFNFKVGKNTFKEINKPLKPGKIKKAEILFKKIETENNKQEKNNQKPNINKQERIEGVMTKQDLVEFNDWQKVDLRVAQITNVEDIKGADKLYKITVNVGKQLGERTICAGLKEHYKKDQLKNKKIILFTNLTPRKMRGIESQGMLLAAVSEDHKKVILISPESDIELGSKIM